MVHLTLDGSELLNEHSVERFQIFAQLSWSLTLTVDVGSLLLDWLLPELLVSLVIWWHSDDILQRKVLAWSVELHFTHIFANFWLDTVDRRKKLRVGNGQCLQFEVRFNRQLTKVYRLWLVIPDVLVVVLNFWESEGLWARVAIDLGNGEFLHRVLHILSCKHVSFRMPHRFLRLLENLHYFCLQVSQNEVTDVLV